MDSDSGQLFPYVFQPKPGEPIAAEWGQLSVAENRLKAEGRRIVLPFVRFRGSTSPVHAPIVFLQGGPGEHVLSDLSACWERPMWRPPMENADFIYIEQREFGLSHPCLTCPGSLNLALNEPGSAEGYTDAHRRYLKRAVTFWREQGVDLAGYNVLETAADIDDLRKALGYEKVSLLGGSFGSHHGLTLLHYYEDFVERAFLFGVEGPDHTMKLPRNVQKQLLQLSRLAKNDPAIASQVPDLLDLMKSVLDRLERHPVRVEVIHPRTGDRGEITLSRYDAQLITANGLGSTSFLKALPRHYLAMKNGDYSWLADQVLGERVDVSDNLMYAAVDCASGATTARRRQVREEAPATLLGNAINEPFHAFCDIFADQDLGDGFRGTFRSRVPTLLVGGTLDARTPISNATELLPHLACGQLPTVEGVSHDLGIEGDHMDHLTRYRNQFLRGEPVAVEHPSASFNFQECENSRS